MYNPSSFKENDPQILFELIRKFNFGILFSQHGDNPEATHLPFLIDEDKNELVAHFAKANKHWKGLDSQKEVLVVFQGPHSYISPSWYENRETVPTLNYATVHVKGTPEIIHEHADLLKMVTDLTQYHEDQVETDWSLKEAESIMDIELKAIVGLKIRINEMEGKFKFNQNRSRADQQKVIEHLDSHANDVKEIMRKNLGENS
jgi:transcriptional regulator